MRAVKRLDSALCKARSAIDHFMRSRCFAGNSKFVSQRYCLGASFLVPRSLKYLGISKANAARPQTEVAGSELIYSMAKNEFDVPAWRPARRDVWNAP
jgi:hypothetical protein